MDESGQQFENRVANIYTQAGPLSEITCFLSQCLAESRKSGFGARLEHAGMLPLLLKVRYGDNLENNMLPNFDGVFAIRGHGNQVMAVAFEAKKNGSPGDMTQLILSTESMKAVLAIVNQPPLCSDVFSTRRPKDLPYISFYPSSLPCSVRVVYNVNVGPENIHPEHIGRPIFHVVSSSDKLRKPGVYEKMGGGLVNVRVWPSNLPRLRGGSPRLCFVNDYLYPDGMIYPEFEAGLYPGGSRGDYLVDANFLFGVDGE